MDGLQGLTYMDSLQDKKRLPQNDASVRFAGEVDRIYLSTPDTLEVCLGLQLRGLFTRMQ